MIKNCVMIALLVLSLALAVHSQDAKVIIISDQDAKLARTTWQEKVDADKAWDNFEHRLVARYTKGDSTGWQNGVTFSEDFKAMVPKTTTMGTITSPCGGIYWNSTTPAVNYLPNITMGNMEIK